MWRLDFSSSPCNIVWTAVHGITQTEDRHTTRVFQLLWPCFFWLSPSFLLHLSRFSLFACPHSLASASACPPLRSRWQPGYGWLHLPGAAADPSVGHSRRRRRLLTRGSTLEELPGPDDPRGARSAPDSSPLTGALAHLPSPLSVRVSKTLCGTWKNCRVQMLIGGSMNNRFLLTCLSKNLFCFYSKSRNNRIKAHQINLCHCVNKILALWSTPTIITTFFPPCLVSSLLP